MDFEAIWQSFIMTQPMDDNHEPFWTPALRNEYMTAISIQGELGLQQLVMSRVWEGPQLSAEEHASMIPSIAETMVQSWTRTTMLSGNRPRVLAMVQAEMAIQQQAMNMVQQMPENDEIVVELINELDGDADEDMEEEPEEEPEMDEDDEQEEDPEMDEEEEPEDEPEEDPEEVVMDEPYEDDESVDSSSTV